MIVDSGLNIGLAVGQDRRIMQDGDAQVVVPPTILPVVLALQPLAAIPGQNDKPTTSFVSFFNTTRVGAIGALENRVCILSKGLWELELSMSTKFTFSNVLPDGLCGFALDYQGNSNIVLLNRFTQIGGFVDYNRLRILLESDADLNELTPAVPAAQAMQAVFSVNAIRIL